MNIVLFLVIIRTYKIIGAEIYSINSLIQIRKNLRIIYNYLGGEAESLLVSIDQGLFFNEVVDKYHVFSSELEL